jgi:hypothetical protein
MTQKLNYHLYLEFWSHKKRQKDHIFMIVERDFRTLEELRLAKDKILAILEEDL